MEKVNYNQVNNNQMGVYVSRVDDSEMYKDTYEEAQRIIRISDEVRISMGKSREPENTEDLPEIIDN